MPPEPQDTTDPARDAMERVLIDRLPDSIDPEERTDLLDRLVAAVGLPGAGVDDIEAAISKRERELADAWAALPDSVAGDAAPEGTSLADRIRALESMRKHDHNGFGRAHEERMRLRAENERLRADVDRLRARTHEIQAQEMAKRAAMDSELAQWRQRWANAKNWSDSVGLTADWAVDSRQSFWRMTSWATRTALLRLVTERDEARVEVEALRGVIDAVQQPLGWALDLDLSDETHKLLTAYLGQMKAAINRGSPAEARDTGTGDRDGHWTVELREPLTDRQIAALARKLAALLEDDEGRGMASWHIAVARLGRELHDALGSALAGDDDRDGGVRNRCGCGEVSIPSMAESVDRGGTRHRFARPCYVLDPSPVPPAPDEDTGTDDRDGLPELTMDNGSEWFAAAMARHGPCICPTDLTESCGQGDARCALCNVLPDDWPCPTVEHDGYAKPAPSSPVPPAPDEAREALRQLVALRVGSHVTPQRWAIAWDRAKAAVLAEAASTPAPDEATSFSEQTRAAHERALRQQARNDYEAIQRAKRSLAEAASAPEETADDHE